MKDTREIIEEVTQKVQQSLNELGLNAEINLSKHDGIVHAIMELDGKSIKIITHVTDREAKPYGSGTISNELAKVRLCNTVIRPTLAQQTSTNMIIMDSLEHKGN
ncbi:MULTISPECIES: hypothetical protein [Bacillus cereus group]|nr:MULTISPECIES: hypothetical protein [Bacillus cereus group]MRB72915.1 hypothetical protein [Bacillus thuringiensis]QUW68481.1 hypothetical protein KFQ04_29425 [Pseudomonas synxantha]MCU5573179.1 hypothetical protein [Bacillus cereus]MEB8637864.1 hypothetical protein [Bacillus cereus]MEB8746081.1 hypothetical protein [Bacillus cereus]